MRLKTQSAYDGLLMKKDPDPKASTPMMIWGILWLVATVGGPVATMLLVWEHEDLAKVNACAAVGLHLMASRQIVKIDAIGGTPLDSYKLSTWLLFGGWALMISVFFFGCVEVFNRGL